MRVLLAVSTNFTDNPRSPGKDPKDTKENFAKCVTL